MKKERGNGSGELASTARREIKQEKQREETTRGDERKEDGLTKARCLFAIEQSDDPRWSGRERGRKKRAIERATNTPRTHRTDSISVSTAKERREDFDLYLKTRGGGLFSAFFRRQMGAIDFSLVVRYQRPRTNDRATTATASPNLSKSRCVAPAIIDVGAQNVPFMSGMAKEMSRAGRYESYKQSLRTRHKFVRDENKQNDQCVIVCPSFGSFASSIVLMYLHIDRLLAVLVFVVGSHICRYVGRWQQRANSVSPVVRAPSVAGVVYVTIVPWPSARVSLPCIRACRDPTQQMATSP
jgi:hypothetical protein